jgi:alternate signal-mediated exported protein
MNNKTKGALAGVAGVAILAGGTTFALWSDSASVNAGVITAGNLDVATVGKPTWFDVSSDRTDADDTTPVSGIDGHVIENLGSWRIVPGDTVEGTQGVAIALEGDNLQAELTVGSSAEIAGNLMSGLRITYDVYDKFGAPIAEGVEFGKSTSMRFQASGDGQAAGEDDPRVLVITDTALRSDSSSNLDVVITAKFDENTDERHLTQAYAQLQQIKVDLVQVREGSGFKTN